ncbi:hypothetical protein J4E91_001438 [Alternaria rosae]|nr:hypothetical protein J4E91_001438 [Alternaria rosae]
MAVLSTQFTNDMEEMPVGNPPQTSKNLTLSRKVQSELNLVAMQKTRPSRSLTSSVASGFSGGSGDPLPDEMTILEHTDMEPATECEAIVALRALGTLVARRRGLDVSSFNHGLMMLFWQTTPAEKLTGRVEDNDTRNPRQEVSSDNGTYEYFDQGLAPRNVLRKFQSQPQLNTTQKHHRQFSFEPGADQLEALTEECRALDGEANESGSDDSDTPLLMRTGHPALDTRSIRSTSSSQVLGADLGKASKIPSPVQTLGRSRRADSASSIQSVYAGPQDIRRGSSSSVVTAFRENSIGSMRPELQSRNNSINNLRMPDSPSVLRNQHSGTGLHYTIMAIAAARAASDASQPSSGRGSPRLCLSRVNSSQGSVRPGDDVPKITSPV